MIDRSLGRSVVPLLGYVLEFQGVWFFTSWRIVILYKLKIPWQTFMQVTEELKISEAMYYSILHVIRVQLH